MTIDDETSPICFEFMAPYGLCYFCEGQAEPSIVVYLDDEGNRTMTEIQWRCKCGKAWLLKHLDLCAVLASPQWPSEVATEGEDKPHPVGLSRRWEPTHTCEGPEGEPFTDEIRDEARQRTFGRGK